MLGLVHNEDGQMEQRSIPYTGTPGGVRTRYQPLSFGLDVLFWAVIGWTSMPVSQNFVQLILAKSTSKAGRTG